MLTTNLKSVQRYNAAIKGIDLADLLSPNSCSKLPKFPKRKKLFRTLSLARELRNLQKEFFYFHENAIAIEIFFGGAFKKRTVCIVANDSCYRVRVDTWTFDKSGGHFYYKEIEQPTGNHLLWELVSLEVLDASFLPKITKHHERINDL